MLNAGVQTGKAVAEALKPGLCGVDPDHPGCERLHKQHITVQEFEQTQWRRISPKLGELNNERLWIRRWAHSTDDVPKALPTPHTTLPTTANCIRWCAAADVLHTG